MLILPISFIGCDPVDDSLIFINQTEYSLYYTFNKSSKLSELYEEGTSPSTYLNYVTEIQPYSKKKVRMMGRKGKAWKNYVENVSEGGKLRIYVFNIDTLKKYSFRNVVNNNRYRYKREYTFEKLEKLKWEVRLD